ncbi:MAG: 3-hydroxyacyl-CoA dehydrogenase [Lachnospiraceae bacterium]|nr:3-hydroxyacyl-CoA dehydrogenase [Lachnospiraceae bacterium]
MKNITVAGGGVLGSQIAFQTAFCGFDVKIWLRSEESIGRTKPKLDRLYNIYKTTLNAAKKELGTGKVFPRGLITDSSKVTEADIDKLLEAVDKAYKEIKLTTSLEEACKDTDLIIESMAENPEAKVSFYKSLDPHLEAKTIVATNSSSMVPSQFREYLSRPQQYLAIHFANNIWISNTAEIMGHSTTSKDAYEAVAKFSSDIKMIPLRLMKEQPGYILNSMLIPFLNAGQMLLANEVADPATIDLTWRLGTGSPYGPFQILDIVGLNTALNIVSNNPLSKDPTTVQGKIKAILEKYISEGKTGVNAGEGFYKYN